MVIGEMAEWCSRPLEPVVFIDAIFVKMRYGQATNRRIYVAICCATPFGTHRAKYWDQIAKDIRPVNTAPAEAAAKERFVEFTAKWGGQYPAVIRLTQNA